MGLTCDDAVLIEKGKKDGEPYVVTVNCPDKTGLGCDICYTILEFGLYITRGDVSTDGIWCYVVLWVVPHSISRVVKWMNLKERLLSICPPTIPLFYLDQSTPQASSPIYLLKFCSLDRKGLLHDVTEVLDELEHTIQRVKVTTTPDGCVLDLFFIKDNLELLHTKARQDELCDRLYSVLGERCISCELQLAGSQYDNLQSVSSLSPVTDELFRFTLSDSDNESRSQALSSNIKELKKASVKTDNSLSPVHTLLQINCVDHKGLLYDIMRTLKDCNIQIAYGRFLPVNSGWRELDLFIQHRDGKKIVDPENQEAICSRLKLEMLHPLRVVITNRGPDTELLVANPTELSGRGRPRVFYDITFALKSLGICVFLAEIGRHSASNHEWEVYRFLLDENCNLELLSMVVRNQIVDKVRRALMGC